MNKKIELTEFEVNELKYTLNKRADSLKWVIENKNPDPKKKEYMKRNIDNLSSIYKKLMD